MLMPKQIKKLILRSLIYAAALLIIISYVILCYNGYGISCFFERNFHVLCPSCGATRAALFMIQGNIKLAVSVSPIFTLVIYPFLAFLVSQDYITIIVNIMKNKNQLSLLEFIFGKRGWS